MPQVRKDCRESKAHQVQLALARQVRQVPPGPKVHKVSRGHPVLRALLGLKVLKVFRVHPDRQALALRVPPDLKVLRGRKAHPVQRVRVKPVRPEQLVRPVRKGFKVHPGRRVLPGHKVRKAFRVHRDQPAQVLRVLLVPKDHRVFKVRLVRPVRVKLEQRAHLVHRGQQV